MPKISYLVRRANTLYFRIRVPSKLQSIVERIEIVQTLQTQSSQDAASIALELAGKAKAIFNELSKGMEGKELHERIVRDLEEEYVKSSDVDIEKSKAIPLPSLLREYKLKRQISVLKDSALDTLIRHHEEVGRVKSENDLLRGVVSSSILTAQVAPEQAKSVAKEEVPMLSFTIDEFIECCGASEQTMNKLTTTLIKRGLSWLCHR